jgi:hypothetical protein
MISDAEELVANGDVGQAVSGGEHAVTNVCDAVGDRYACQAGTATIAEEHIITDAGDREAIDCAGDGHRSDGVAAAAITRNGDRAVISLIIKIPEHLGLHHRGQHQKQEEGQNPKSVGTPPSYYPHPGKEELAVGFFHAVRSFGERSHIFRCLLA